MKHPLHLLGLALLLALHSAPAATWNCSMSSPRGSDPLMCARLCAASEALLTQGGKLAGLGTGACMQAKLQLSSSALALAKAELPTPQVAFAPLAQAPRAMSAAPALKPMSCRAPPLPSLFLSSAHPSSQAPPTLA